MLAVRAAKPFHRLGWVYEEKVDGWRLLAYKDGCGVRLQSRNGVDHSGRFASLATAISKLHPGRLILDGEVAVFDEKLISQFHLLHDPNPTITCTPPILMAFDCLWLGGRDLRRESLNARRRALEEAIAGAELIFPIRRLPAEGHEAWDVARKGGYEGLVAKDGESHYQAGASRSWVKIKVREDGQFLVGGVGETADRAPRLYVGERVDGGLVYRGTVELGVGPALVAELLKRGRRRRTSAFAGLSWRNVIWLEPTIPVDVSYGRVMQGWLREPACRGLAMPVSTKH
jgi:bifunctional non-homologous end joining protein LigD